MPAVPALESQEQKEAESKASESHTVRFYLNNHENQTGLVAHAFNPGRQDIEMGTLLQIQGLRGLHRKFHISQY